MPHSEEATQHHALRLPTAVRVSEPRPGWVPLPAAWELRRDRLTSADTAATPVCTRALAAGRRTPGHETPACTRALAAGRWTPGHEVPTRAFTGQAGAARPVRIPAFGQDKLCNLRGPCRMRTQGLPPQRVDGVETERAERQPL